jgi:hypothetical protein
MIDKRLMMRSLMNLQSLTMHLAVLFQSINVRFPRFRRRGCPQDSTSAHCHQDYTCDDHSHGWSTIR